MHMQRLNKEMEDFFNNRYSDHEELKSEIEKWTQKTDKNLAKLEKQAASFESDFENRFERVDKWLAKKQKGLESKFKE
ncbi:hypothetical protein [Litchfieldia alkalitelluris]|uniref:hypothetical protein n=1 Tax=Litchfieldia alkalitelluris TaxID=304268 RepID=UPI000998948E|nr:hypothetical protein [Litchfieldia alkalitelluris]